MKNPKRFDCVEMKREIQRRLRRESTGKVAEAVRRAQWKRAVSDPFLRSLLSAIASRATVAEEPLNRRA